MKTIQYYSAPWCQPCKVFGPIVSEFVDSLESYDLERINIEENPEEAIKEGITSIPVLLVKNENGEEIYRLVGAKPRAYLDKELLPLLTE